MHTLKKTEVNGVHGARKEVFCDIVNCDYYDYFSAISAKAAVCISIGKIGMHVGTHGMIAGFMLCMGYNVASIYVKYKKGYDHVYSGKSCKLV